MTPSLIFSLSDLIACRIWYFSSCRWRDIKLSQTCTCSDDSVYCQLFLPRYPTNSWIELLYSRYWLIDWSVELIPVSTIIVVAIFFHVWHADYLVSFPVIPFTTIFHIMTKKQIYDSFSSPNISSYDLISTYFFL